jgi:hypothetical protein
MTLHSMLARKYFFFQARTNRLWARYPSEMNLAHSGAPSMILPGWEMSRHTSLALSSEEPSFIGNKILGVWRNQVSLVEHLVRMNASPTTRQPGLDLPWALWSGPRGRLVQVGGSLGGLDLHRSCPNIRLSVRVVLYIAQLSAGKALVVD